jgi:translation elongation factor aEF-1 beta
VTKKYVDRNLGEKTMGKIVIAYKIFPSESSVDLKLLKEKIEKQLSDIASVQRFAEEPIAFGLSALIVNMILPDDKEGILDETEKRLTDMEEVSQIQTLGVNRL